MARRADPGETTPQTRPRTGNRSGPSVWPQEQLSVATARYTGVGGTDHGRGDERALPGQQGLGGIDPEEQWFWDLCGM